MKIAKLIFEFLLVAALAAGGYYVMLGLKQPEGEASNSARYGQGGPVAVLAAPVKTANVPVYLTGIGSAKALNTVSVRPQVDGKILSINFKEGQDVKKGDVLAKIDPVTYQAQLDQALAKKALDEAQLSNTRRDLARFEKVGTLAISQQQIDTQKALILQQEAQIKSDAAAIENLTAVLGYTSVIAPIDGRTGIRQVDEGNLVRAGDANGIVVITQIHPISVIFTLPQQSLPQLRKALSGTPLKVEAFTTDGRSLLGAGTLQVVDNQVDPLTGTVRLKAEFPNEQLQLWPGQFLNVRVLVDTLNDAIVAPAAAIQRGPNGAFVFVVAEDSTVAMRAVEVAQQDQADAVISKGLKAGETIVTSGFGRLEQGSKVKISDAQSPVADAAASTNSPVNAPAPATGQAAAAAAATPAAAPDVPKSGDAAASPQEMPPQDGKSASHRGKRKDNGGTP